MMSLTGRKAYVGVAAICLLWLMLREYSPLSNNFRLLSKSAYHIEIEDDDDRISPQKLLPAFQNKTTDFFIRTWKGDGHWLCYLLRSIEKFVDKKSYRHLIITYNESEHDYFKSFLLLYDLPIKLAPFVDSPAWNTGLNKGGYKAQMFAKMIAHTFSDADYFVNVDSDCIFTKHVNSSHFYDSSGRVYVQHVPFSALGKDNQMWKKPAEELLNFKIEHETMTRLPIVYPRDLYISFFDHLIRMHPTSPKRKMLSMRFFNEFTSMGAYLMYRMPERWTNLPASKKNILYQSWSWGGFTPAIAGHFECILRAKDLCLCTPFGAEETRIKWSSYVSEDCSF